MSDANLSIPQFIALAAPFFRGELVRKVDLDEAAGRASALQCQVEEQTRRIGALSEENKLLHEKLVAQKGEMEGLQSALEAAKAAAKEQAESVKVEAAKAAAGIVAGLHVHPLPAKGAEGIGGGDSREELWRQYKAIASSRERAVFWMKHKGKMMT